MTITPFFRCFPKMPPFYSLLPVVALCSSLARSAATPAATLAATTPVTCEPYHVHLAGTGSPFVAISWSTSATGCPSVVKYGTTPSNLDQSASSPDEPHSYTMIEEAGTYSSPQLRDVTIEGLKPDTEYFYQVAENTTTHSFFTAPYHTSYPTRFAVVGDLGQTANR